MFSFKKAGKEEIPAIQQIAQLTWPGVYHSILGEKQVAYMLDALYNTAALTTLFDSLHEFYFIYRDDSLAGFASFSRINHSSTFKLHKIYVLPAQQGAGTGTALLDFVVLKVKSLGAQQLLLNVNRYNKARFFYEKMGFVIIKEEDIDIGNGFFMNDYLMVLSFD